MFGSDILDIAIGLVLVYLLMSLIMTAVQEAVSALLKQRAANLRSALLQLMQGDTALLQAFYQHPLVAGLYEGELRQPGWLRRGANFPSYIPREIFAAAVRDLSQQERFAGGEALKGILDSVQSVAGLDVQAQQRQLELWYDSAMDRASGWYKRHTQKVLFVAGLLAAVLMNVNSVTIAQYLAVNPQQRELVVALAQKAAPQSPAQSAASADADAAGTPTAEGDSSGNQSTAAEPEAGDGGEAVANTAAAAPPQSSGGAEGEDDAGGGAAAAGDGAATAQPTVPINKEQLEEFTNELREIGLPIGWSRTSVNWARRLFPTDSLDWSWDPRDFSLSVALAWFLLIAGYFITAFAVMLGAPFWFDVLNKFMVIRGTVKPKEKSADESSEDRQTSAGRPATASPAVPPAAPPGAPEPHGPAPDRLGDTDSPVFG